VFVASIRLQKWPTNVHNIHWTYRGRQFLVELGEEGRVVRVHHEGEGQL
jgi:hypothetical protein